MTIGALAIFLRSFWVVWLVLVFLAIVFWAFRPRNKARFEADAQIPLDDDRVEKP